MSVIEYACHRRQRAHAWVTNTDDDTTTLGDRGNGGEGCGNIVIQFRFHAGVALGCLEPAFTNVKGCKPRVVGNTGLAQRGASPRTLFIRQAEERLPSGLLPGPEYFRRGVPPVLSQSVDGFADIII